MRVAVISAYSKEPLDVLRRCHDSVLMHAVCAGGYSRCHSTAPTVNYTSTLAYHYRMFGETPPDDSRVIAQVTGEAHFRVFTYAQTQAQAQTIGGVPGW